MTSIAVLGAGVTGVTTAASLAERGYDVTVFERRRYAAMETSFANGGQLSASNAEVWNSWPTVLKGLTWLFRADAPLSINLRPSWRKYSWLASFLANIPGHDARTKATARLAMLSQARLGEIAARYGVDFDRVDRGILHVYRDAKDFATAERVSALYAEVGLTRRSITAEEIRAIEPTIAPDFYAGCYTESDFTGDVHKFSLGLARALAARGVRFEYGAEVASARAGADGVRIMWRDAEGALEQSRFDAVVVAAGVKSRDFAVGFGDHLPIYPVKGYSITVELRDQASRAAAPTVSLLDDAAKIVTSRLGADRFRIAGTAEFNGENRDIRADRIAPLTRWCETLFPGVSTEHVTPWAGLRPMTPSMTPKVGPGRRKGVFYNTGHGHLGWTLSAATAEIVAEAVAGAPLERPTRRPLTPEATARPAAV